MMLQNSSEKTLAIALKSLDRVYNELIIVDEGSSDYTCNIVLSYEVKVIHSKWSSNHSPQINLYLKAVNTEWIFVLGSDEFIDQKTLSCLHQIKSFSSTIDTENFWLPRKWISSFQKKITILIANHTILIGKVVYLNIIKKIL